MRAREHTLPSAIVVDLFLADVEVCLKYVWGKDMNIDQVQKVLLGQDYVFMAWSKDLSNFENVGFATTRHGGSVRPASRKDPTSSHHTLSTSAPIIHILGSKHLPQR